MLVSKSSIQKEFGSRQAEFPPPGERLNGLFEAEYGETPQQPAPNPAPQDPPRQYPPYQQPYPEQPRQPPYPPQQGQGWS